MRKKIPVLLTAFVFSSVIWASISLSNQYYATYQIPVKVVNFPGGYTSGSSIPQNISVKLKGEGWKLLALNFSTGSEYVISAGQDSGKRFVNLYNYLVENQWLSSGLEVIDITPDTLSFDVERIINKKVKVIPDLRLEYKPGYGLASDVSINPDSIMVYGPLNFINDLDYVKTEPISEKNVDERIYRNVNLAAKPGMSFSSSIVGVNLDVQQIMEKEFSDLNVEVIDVPSDRNVVLLPNKVNLGIKGGINILGKLKSSDFRAYIYYRDVVIDTTGSIAPRIELPFNTAMIYSKPERLRYIIKKFN